MYQVLIRFASSCVEQAIKVWTIYPLAFLPFKIKTNPHDSLKGRISQQHQLYINSCTINLHHFETRISLIFWSPSSSKHFHLFYCIFWTRWQSHRITAVPPLTKTGERVNQPNQSTSLLAHPLAICLWGLVGLTKVQTLCCFVPFFF